ncbi:MAG: peptide-binding protein [Vulcanimicrobiaceae bacterium]
MTATFARRAGSALALVAALACGSCARPGARAAHTDVLRIAARQDPPGLNPLLSDNAALQDLVPLLHGFLLSVDARGNFTPDLASVVPSRANGGIAPDGRTIRYRLRRGVRWHDGVPFDARDVAFSFAAARNRRNNVPDRSGFDDIASVTAHGAYDVEVRLRRAYSPALATFFTFGANDPYAILPAHLLAKLPDLNAAAYNGHPIGLGPYRLASWSHGSELVFEADPNFRRGAAKIRRIDVRVVPDSNTEVALWQAGELDYLSVRGFAGSRAMLAGARSVAHARQVLSDHYQFDYVMFNVARGALRERAVRAAIVRGVDRERIERDVRGELHRPGDGDRLPGQFAYDPSIRQAPYDPAGAARLLDGAGWRMHGGVRERGGVPLALEIVGPSGSSGAERLALQLQAELAKLGIRASIKAYQYNLLFAQGGIYQSGRFDLAFYGWQPGEDADHSYLFRCDTRPPNGENYGRICDPLIDRAAAIEMTTTDRALEMRADRAMLRELDAQSDLLFLGFDREALFLRDGIAGLEPSVLGHHFWNIDRWHFVAAPAP